MEASAVLALDSLDAPSRSTRDSDGGAFGDGVAALKSIHRLERLLPRAVRIDSHGIPLICDIDTGVI